MSESCLDIRIADVYAVKLRPDYDSSAFAQVWIWNSIPFLMHTKSNYVIKIYTKFSNAQIHRFDLQNDLKKRSFNL